MVLLRTASDPMALATAVRREMTSVNTRVVVTAVSTLEEVASESIADQRLRAALVSLFSALALGLGMLGIYGVMSYTVARRTQEIGIRMALGAQEQQVSRMIVREALGWTGTGIALGLAGAYAAGRWIATLLFGVHPADPVTLAATCLVVAGVAVAASYGPARRAMRVDPVVALRAE